MNSVHSVRASSRVRATGLSPTSWVLFASSGPLTKGVMSAGWSPAAVTSVRSRWPRCRWRQWSRYRGRGHRGSAAAELWPLLSYGLLGVAGVQLFFFVARSESRGT